MFTPPLILVASCFLVAVAPEQPVLVLVTGKDLKSTVGELASESDTHIEVLDLRTGEKTTFDKRDLKGVRKYISEAAAIERFGLPVYMAWRTKKLLPATEAAGKVAAIDGAFVYVSTQTSVGLEVGQELLVYRRGSEIRDPQTGEPLGQQRRKIARLEIVAIDDKMIKAKPVGDFEVKIEEGDEVLLSVGRKAVAVLPLVDSTGSTESTHRLADDLTTELVNFGVPVVERRLLDPVLGELARQQDRAYDAASIERLGKQLGAYAVVVGTVAPKGKLAEARVRLVRVETGEILVAATHVLREAQEVRKPVPSDQARLQGKWVAVRGEFQGKVPPESFWNSKYTLSVSGDRFVLVLSDGVWQGTFALDSTAVPKQITFHTDRKATLVGIYTLQDEELITSWAIHLVGKATPKRPQSFQTQAGQFKFIWRKQE